MIALQYFLVLVWDVLKLFQRLWVWWQIFPPFSTNSFINILSLRQLARHTWRYCRQLVPQPLGWWLRWISRSFFLYLLHNHFSFATSLVWRMQVRRCGWAFYNNYMTQRMSSSNSNSAGCTLACSHSLAVPVDLTSSLPQTHVHEAVNNQFSADNFRHFTFLFFFVVFSLTAHELMITILNVSRRSTPSKNYQATVLTDWNIISRTIVKVPCIRVTTELLLVLSPTPRFTHFLDLVG